MRQEVLTVASTTIAVSITLEAPAEAIFAVLVDPAKHAAIDGTGWVGGTRAGAPRGPRFPLFSRDHLDNSLTHLADLVVP